MNVEKQKLINLSRRGFHNVEEENNYKTVLKELQAAGCQGPGMDGLDYCERPFFRTALWESSWKGHEKIVKLLHEAQASVDAKDYQARTPLHEAAYYGHKNLVEYFLEKG